MPLLTPAFSCHFSSLTLFWRGPLGRHGRSYFTLQTSSGLCAMTASGRLRVSYGASMERANHKFVSRPAADLWGGRQMSVRPSFLTALPRLYFLSLCLTLSLCPSVLLLTYQLCCSLTLAVFLPASVHIQCPILSICGASMSFSFCYVSDIFRDELYNVFFGST